MMIVFLVLDYESPNSFGLQIISTVLNALRFATRVPANVFYNNYCSCSVLLYKIHDIADALSLLDSIITILSW